MFNFISSKFLRNLFLKKFFLKFYFMKKFFIFFAGIISLNLLYSQSLLWKVSGKNIKSPSFIYGTIHIQDKRVFEFDKTVLDALLSCDAFAMEILLDEVSPSEIKEAMFMKKHTIKDFLTPQQYEILDSIVKVKTGVGMIIYNKMKPFFLSSQIMQLSIKKDMELPLDLYFLKIARENNKSCFGVEKFSHQVAAIDAIPLKDQVDMLYQGLTDTVRNNDSIKLNEMLNAYLNFDLQAVFEMTQDTSLPENFNKAFLIDRNKVMVKNFINIAKKHSLFCAVGAAHLPGEKGILELLREKGYVVEPVVFKWVK